MPSWGWEGCPASPPHRRRGFPWMAWPTRTVGADCPITGSNQSPELRMHVIAKLRVVMRSSEARRTSVNVHHWSVQHTVMRAKVVSITSAGR
jgi:hypothetical protein